MHQDKRIDTIIRKVVDIVGIAIGDCGHSFEEHIICGSVLASNVIVRLRKEDAPPGLHNLTTGIIRTNQFKDEINAMTITEIDVLCAIIFG